MKTTKQHKTRFRKNLAQFAKLKANGTLNGSASAIKDKLHAAAGDIGLDFEKELADVKRETGDVKRGNPQKPMSVEKIKTLVKKALAHKDFKNFLDIAEVKKSHAKKIRNLIGIDVQNYKYILQADAIRHAINKHGDKQKEEARGQVPITAKDFEKLNLILSNPDEITKGEKTKRGLQTVIYQKNIDDKLFCVQEVRTGRKKLAIITMWKHRIEGPRANSKNERVAHTSETCLNHDTSTKRPAGTSGGTSPKEKLPGRPSTSQSKDTKNSSKRENPETETVCVDDITCEVTVKANTNAAKGGIEIRFSGDPGEDIRQQLKDRDFWFYSPANAAPFWAGKITTANKQYAENLAGTFDSAVVNLKPKSGKNEAGSEKQQAGSKSHETSQRGDLRRDDGIVFGKSATVDFTADGSIQEHGYYGLAEISEVQASHNKDCTPNSKHTISRSQPRDRSSEALCAQPNFIAKHLNPASITQGNLAFVGTPVTMASLQDIQGNGRTIALKIAYDEIPASAKKYKDYLISHAGNWGFAKADIKAFNQPVLIRVLNVSMDRAIELGNVVDTSQAKMSKIDQAKAYIRNLNENQLQIIGQLIQNSDGETIGQIIDDVGLDIIGQLDKLDRTGIVEKNKLTVEGKDFLRSVLVGLVFDSEDHPNALHHYLKLPHTIKRGLERSFGYIIPLIGQPGDVTDVLTRAVEVAAQVYTNEAMDSAADYTGAKDMFEAKDFTSQETALAQFLLDQSTQKAIRDAFRYYDELLKGKKTLFAEAKPKSKKEALKMVFIDRTRPNPGNFRDDIIHDTIVRAQRLQNFGHQNTKELNHLSNLVGHDGWKWNDKKTKIILLNNDEARHKRLVILEHFKSQTTGKKSFEKFKSFLKREYPEKLASAADIFYTIKPGAWRKSRENPGRLTAGTKRAVLDDFYRWMNDNPLMDYEPGEKTFQNWIPYHYPGFQDAAGDIWATARPALRANPAARFIYMGVCKALIIDQGEVDTIKLEGPHAMLTNKAMNKVFIVPFSEIKDFDKPVDDLTADDVFETWNNYAPDDDNFSLHWPENEKALPVGTAKETYYISDKMIRENDRKGKMNVYHHQFDAGRRPCSKKGKILIVSNLNISERGILN